MSALVCGLDVHKDSTYATILNDEGKIVNQTRMSNERVLSYLAHYKVKRVAMESSKAVAPLYRKLENKGFEVVVGWLGLKFSPLRLTTVCNLIVTN